MNTASISDFIQSFSLKKKMGSLGQFLFLSQGLKLTSELEMSQRVLVSMRKVRAIQGDPASKITRDWGASSAVTHTGALAGDQGSVPGTHIRWLTTTYSSR